MVRYSCLFSIRYCRDICSAVSATAFEHCLLLQKSDHDVHSVVVFRLTEVHVICNLQGAAVRLAHDTGNPVQHPVLDRVRSCSSHPDDAVSFFESLFCPVPEQRLLPHQAQSHPYLKLVVDTMRHDQATRGVHIASKAEADEEVASPHGFDSDEAWGVGPVVLANSSGLGAIGKKVKAPTFHNRSKQLRRCKRHWWQSDKKHDVYGAAGDMSCDVGQPKQTGRASQNKAHVKYELYRPHAFEPSPKDFRADKQATGATLGLLAPVKSKVTSHEDGGQADAALQRTSKLITSSVLIEAVSSWQQLAANSHVIAATASQADGVPVSFDGMHAAVGHTADNSQLLQPSDCSWQQTDQEELAPGTLSTGGSAPAIQDTSCGHHEHGSEQGKAR